MQAFAELLDSLSFQPARNSKLRLIETYLRQAPDPDRGWALAALTAELDFASAKPALLRGLGEEKIGAELFHWSHDYVGDLAETLALVWSVRRMPVQRRCWAKSSRRCSAPPRYRRPGSSGA